MELPDEVIVLAKTAYGEARGSCDDEVRGVCQVILNRVNKPGWWGRDIISVCYHPYQFSCWNKDDPNRAILLEVTFDDKDFQRVLGLALQVYSGKYLNKVGKATNYHTQKNPIPGEMWPPTWTRSMHLIAVLQDHLYYVEK